MTIQSSLKLAAGYVRCSTEMQEDSPEQQRREIEKFALAQGYKLVDWFVDFGKSGTTFEQRPEFMRMRAAVDQKAAFRFVICYDESRWGRALDTDESTHWKFHFRKRGVEVVLVKTSVDAKNDFAPMLTAMEAVQASQYSKKLSEVVMRGMLANAKYSNGGTAPFGYKRVAMNKVTGERRELKTFFDERSGKFIGERSAGQVEDVVWDLGDAAEVAAVKKIFRMRIEGHPWRSIVHHLNTNNVRCSQRGRWRNVDSKWSINSVRDVITNHAYYGTRVYNQTTESKIIAKKKGFDTVEASPRKYWRNERSEWVMTADAHPAIITKEDWDKANAMMRQSERSGGAVARSEYLLTGLIHCSRCGFSFYGRMNTRKGHQYHWYSDSGWDMKHICSSFHIKRDEIEGYVLSRVKLVLTNADMVERIIEARRVLIALEPVENTARREWLDARLRELEERIAHLVVAIESGKQLDSLLVRLEALEKEKARWMEERREIEVRQPRVMSEDKVAAEVKQYLSEFEERFKSGGIGEKKLLMRQCVAGVILDRERGVAKCYVRRIPAIDAELVQMYRRVEYQEEMERVEGAGGIENETAPMEEAVVRTGSRRSGNIGNLTTFYDALEVSLVA